MLWGVVAEAGTGTEGRRDSTVLSLLPGTALASCRLALCLPVADAVSVIPTLVGTGQELSQHTRASKYLLNGPMFAERSKSLLVEQMSVKRTLGFLEKLLPVHRLLSLLWGSWTRMEAQNPP